MMGSDGRGAKPPLPGVFGAKATPSPEQQSTRLTAWGSGQFRRDSHELPVVSMVPASGPDATGTTTLVHLLCSAGSDMLEPTHAYLTAYATNRFGSRAGERISVAVYELIANAMSYGSLGDITIELTEEAMSKGVRVTNTTTPARIEMLATHVNRLRADPGKTLLEEMRRSGSGGMRPMLGLARVVHEAGFQLDVDFTSRKVTVWARSRT
jgi:hypothetical protein